MRSGSNGSDGPRVRYLGITPEDRAFIDGTWTEHIDRMDETPGGARMVHWRRGGSIRAHTIARIAAELWNEAGHVGSVYRASVDDWIQRNGHRDMSRITP